MKIIYLLALVLLSLQNLRSQVVFCPPGAKWNYLWGYSFSPWPQAAYNEQIVYRGDTIIGTDSVKILQHRFFSYECLGYSCNPTFLKQRGDTIFMWNPCTLGGWQILYNFAATAGSGWQNLIKRSPTAALTCTYNVTVNSINTVTINGISLKQLVATYQFYYSSLSSSSTVTITERLGSSRYLFNFRNYTSTDCNYISGNLCYTDSSFGLHQYTQFPCDYSNPIGLTENSATFDRILYPNPAKEFLEICLPNGASIEQPVIYDVQGRLVDVKAGEGNTIDIQNLVPGLYFLEVKTKTGSYPFRKKFIKE